ncbi:hypothetical protein ACFSJ3_09345 [Corallincola platygyrae]|uniref:PEP-CTERM sorting domain-containing protein n=1 Tax=Corallincola platygyrae TaxID=1193278 RepID=A0ABW4XKV4_9GAMM
MIQLKWLVAGFATLFASSALAAIIGVSDGGRLIDAPAVIDDDSIMCTAFSPEQSCEMLGFDEKQGVSLAAPLEVDGGEILGGDVNSHMIFLNTEGRLFASLSVDWWFDGKIIGVMSDRNGKLEAASSELLGAGGTSYPASFWLRGLERNDSYSVAGNLFTLNSRVKEPGDWVRVVTRAMIPTPPSWLLGLGILIVAFAGRVRRTSC